MEELKPCPFCGNTELKIKVYKKDDVNFFSDKYAVQCEYSGSDFGCGAEGQINKHKDIAIDCWNTRKQPLIEWVSVEDRFPEIKDDSVLAYFKNGSIETVHIEDNFKDITAGFDATGKQLYTKWYKNANITHWMPLPEPPNTGKQDA
jgi:hypothetical protein